MEESRVEIHISDIRTFLECRLRWLFSSPLRMNLEPALPYIPFLLGRGVHEALAGYYTSPGRTGCETAYREWAQKAVEGLKDVPTSDTKRTEINEALMLGLKMTQHYDLWAPRHDDFKVIAPEYEVSVPLGIQVRGMDIWYAGKCDGVARTRDGKVRLLEFKTCARFPDPKTLAYDDQGLSYLAAAARSADFPRPEDVPTEMLFTFMRKKAPTTPATLIKGGLSKNKRIDTSYEHYLHTLLARGEASLAPYEEILLHLEAQEKFFRRHVVRHTKQALDFHWQCLQAVAREMLSTDLPIYPAPGWYKCGRCFFAEPCKMVRERLSPEPLLATGYRQREKEKEEEDAGKEGSSLDTRPKEG